MDNQEFKNANEYIEHLYEKFLGEVDKSTFPKTLFEDFDMRLFGQLCSSKDIYDLLIASNPCEEIDSFYEILNTTRDKEQIKNFSFERTLKLQEIFTRLYNVCEECSIETSEKVNPEGEAQDSRELEFFMFIDVQYSSEFLRIDKLLKTLTKKCKDIASSIGSITDKDLDAKQIEILMLLEDIKDNEAVNPEKLMKGAMDIYAQMKENILS